MVLWLRHTKKKRILISQRVIHIEEVVQHQEDDGKDRGGIILFKKWKLLKLGDCYILGFIKIFCIFLQMFEIIYNKRVKKVDDEQNGQYSSTLLLKKVVCAHEYRKSRRRCNKMCPHHWLSLSSGIREGSILFYVLLCIFQVFYKMTRCYHDRWKTLLKSFLVLKQSPRE